MIFLAAAEAAALGAVLGGLFVLALELEDHFISEIGGPFLPAFGVEAFGFELRYSLPFPALNGDRVDGLIAVLLLDDMKSVVEDTAPTLAVSEASSIASGPRHQLLLAVCTRSRRCSTSW